MSFIQQILMGIIAGGIIIYCIGIRIYRLIFGQSINVDNIDNGNDIIKKDKTDDMKIIKKKKKKKNKKKEEFMKMINSLSTMNEIDSDDDNNNNNDMNHIELKKKFEAMIDSDKLKEKYKTFYAFKVAGFDDSVIPSYNGDVNHGNKSVTMEDMINFMMEQHAALKRDPELKHEMKRYLSQFR